MEELAAAATLQTVALVPSAAEYAQKALGWWALLSDSVDDHLKTTIAQAEAKARADTPLPADDAMLACMARDAAFVWSAVLSAPPAALTNAVLLRDAGHSLQVPE
jgi:hypothetical protein